MVFSDVSVAPFIGRGAIRVPAAVVAARPVVAVASDMAAASVLPSPLPFSPALHGLPSARLVARPLAATAIGDDGGHDGGDGGARR